MKNIILLGLCSFFAGSGCRYSPAWDPTDVTLTQVKTYAAEEVKLISPQIKSFNAPEASRQYEYELSASSRLLLRLEIMKNIANEVLDEQPVILRITPHSRTPIENARQSLKLCPLTSNWMMYATWAKAHPYANGRWNSAGGDFDSEGCLQALSSDSDLLQNSDERSFCQEDNFLCYDIRGHLKSYIRARGVNYGWILVSEENIAIYGDYTARGPEVLYRKFRW